MRRCFRAGPRTDSAQSSDPPLASPLQHVLPFGMAGDLRLGEGAERDDAAVLGTSVLDRAGDQRLSGAAATQRVGHPGVVDDDRRRAEPRIGQLGPPKPVRPPRATPPYGTRSRRYAMPNCRLKCCQWKRLHLRFWRAAQGHTGARIMSQFPLPFRTKPLRRKDIIASDRIDRCPPPMVRCPRKVPFSWAIGVGPTRASTCSPVI